jgi:hypothetical protein
VAGRGVRCAAGVRVCVCVCVRARVCGYVGGCVFVQHPVERRAQRRRQQLTAIFTEAKAIQHPQCLAVTSAAGEARRQGRLLHRSRMKGIRGTARQYRGLRVHGVVVDGAELEATGARLSVLQQQLHHLGLVAFQCPLQRGLAVPAWLVGVGAGCDEQLHHAHMARRRRQHESRVPGCSAGRAQPPRRSGSSPPRPHP